MGPCSSQGPQEAGATMATCLAPPPPPSLSPRRPTARLPPPLASVAPLTATSTSSPSPVVRWTVLSQLLIVTAVQKWDGVLLRPPTSPSSLRWFPSSLESASTTTTGRTLPTVSLLATNSCPVDPTYSSTNPCFVAKLRLTIKREYHFHVKIL